MNAEHINPFVQGAQSTLCMISSESPSLGSLSLKKAPFKLRNVSIFVDIFGDIDGHVVFTLNVADACMIASKMMGGAAVMSLDSMAGSALSELGNMIAGNIATKFSIKGINVDISTPRLKIDASGSDFSFVPPGMAMICIPLTFTDGLVFELDIFIS